MHSSPPKFEVRPALAALLGSLFAACATPPPAAPPPPPPLAGAADIVIGTSFPLESEVLGQTRTINVCLPSGYADRSEAFPVLYLLDGGVQQDLLPVTGFGALATLSGQYEEFIVVGIQTDDRRYELTSPSALPYDLWQIPNNGGAEQFRHFITEEVQPWVDQRYRTTGETAVLGESLAGLFIVDTFLRAPASFDHYLAVSPSLWWEGQALAQSAAERFETGDLYAGRSLYLTVADETDILAAIEHLIIALEEHAPEQLTWWFEPLPEEHHNTIYHPATLTALRRIFGPESER